MHSVALRRNEPDKETPGWECGRAILQPYALFSQDLQASGNIEGEKKKSGIVARIVWTQETIYAYFHKYLEGGWGGERKVHNLDLQRGMFNLHSTLTTYMELYSPPLSKHR